MKVLYIAAAVPYNKVGHAGGQTLNFYIKQMARQRDVNITIVTYCSPEILPELDLQENGIRLIPIIKKGGIKDCIGNVISIWSKINPCHKFGNIMTKYSSDLLIKQLKELSNNGYIPDVIIMEWTQIIIQVKAIKHVFPKALLVASEHDVTFLGLIRQANLEKRWFAHLYKEIRAKNMEKRELNALNICDLIFTHNFKDDVLLKDAGIEKKKREILAPFYHQSILKRQKENNDIIFFGNMKRKENYLAAFWFIDNVMPLLEQFSVRFVVLGGGPNENLKKRVSERVIVTGFVDDIDPWFSRALCFVAPLQLGAGIKVKVIEAMYTGIPVLTNDIGIEGINAVSGKDYYNCLMPKDYADVIISLLNDENHIANSNGKKIIEKMFSLEKSFENYYKSICNCFNKSTH